MSLGAPLLEVHDLVKHFPARSPGQRGRVVHAVCGVSFEVGVGETLGLVGESGCGKSTTARMIVGLTPPTAGRVRFGGADLLVAKGAALRSMHKRLQIVFQDAAASLDPRRTVGSSIAEPLRIHGSYRHGGKERVLDLMRLVELDPGLARRSPHQLSGGQRQRVSIARALALEPEMIILDEPVSSLDASIQAGVVNLLGELQHELGVAYLFISHDLSVVRHISHRVAVMYLGKLVETGTRDDVFLRPAHPYTQALLSAMPEPNPRVERARQRIPLRGEPSSLTDPPAGCRFSSRCWKATELCAEQEPALVDRGQGHPVACHFPASQPTSPRRPALA